MGLTRSSSGLLLRDDFGSDTSANYYVSNSKAMTVSGGLAYADGGCAIGPGAATLNISGNCVTISALRTAGYTAAMPCTFGANNPTTTWTGYGIQFRNSTSLWSSYHDGGVIATDNDDLPAGTQYIFLRVWCGSGAQKGWGGCTWPLQAYIAGTEAVHDHGAATVYSGFQFPDATRRVSYLDCRTSYTITCTDLPADYQLQANASATYKATAVGGTATLDVGVLEWPLTSVEVLDAANAQVFQVDTGDYADMGGGDAFAYAADASNYFIPSIMQTHIIPSQIGG